MMRLLGKSLILKNISPIKIAISVGIVSFVFYFSVTTYLIGFSQDWFNGELKMREDLLNNPLNGSPESSNILDDNDTMPTLTFDGH